ncbi:MAG: hypothetical protein JWN72_188, partial [Thermoleophilia bacterium]|nr:hypothetical protein [Thermoleophilia bacterium]
MLLTLVAAVGAVYLIAPRRRHPVPSRVRPGDHVVTDEGLEGWVEQVDGPAARIRIDAGPSIWARAGDLMTAPSSRTRSTAGHGSPTPDADTGDTGGFASPAPQLQHLADSGGALARLAARVYDHRKRTIVVWALVLVAALPLAGTAAKAFTPGGFLPSGSETGRVQESMGPRFGLPQTTLHVIVDEPVATAGPKLADLRAHPGALEHLIFTGQPTASTDGRSTAIEYGFSVSDEQVQLQIAPLEAALAKRGFDAAHIRVAGVAAMFHDIETQTNEDLAKAESIGMPVAMVVLILVFGTLVAAFVPMLVGVMSVLVTLAVLHLISTQYGLSIYVMNIASMLGLGLGIDY